MKRRNLFKLIAGAACAAALDLTGALKPEWKVSARRMVPNPLYYTAEYEEVFLFSSEFRGFANNLTRYNMVDGRMEQVPPTIEITLPPLE